MGVARRVAAIGVCSVLLVSMGVTGAVGSTSRARRYDATGVLRAGEALSSSGATVRDPRISALLRDITWLQAMYAPLMRLDPKSAKFVPYLAQSVDVTNPKSVTVTLRSDAMFDN